MESLDVNIEEAALRNDELQPVTLNEVNHAVDFGKSGVIATPDFTRNLTLRRLGYERQ